MNNFDRAQRDFENHRELQHTEEDHENECEQCGQPCNRMFCSRSCYLIGKADYDMDQEK